MRLLLLLLLSGPAFAEDALTASRDHYARGRALFLENHNAEALREFQTGFELVPRPEFLINMGLCQSRLGRLREARDLYRKFLAAAPAGHPQRLNVQELLEKVEADLQTQPSPEPLVIAPLRSPSPAAVVEAVAAPPKKSFARRNWWIFPVVGVVVAGVAVGLGVGLTQKGGCDGKGLCVDASQ